MNRRAQAPARTFEKAFDKGSQLATLDTFRQALEAARSGNHAAAIIFYRQTIAQRPNYAEAHNFLGSSLREQGDLAGAIASYEQALSLQPHRLDIKAHLAETLRRSGSTSQAIGVCDKIIGAQKKNAQAYLIRGLAKKSDGNPDGAIDDLVLSARYKKDVPTLKMLARLLIEAGRKAEAFTHLDTARAIDPKDFETFRLCGDCLSGIGRMKEAFEAYRTAIDLNPNDPFSYANLAGMLSFTGQIDLAIAAGKIAIQLAPNMHGAHFNLGMAYETKIEFREAIDAYAAAFRCKPDLGVALLAMCRLLRHECAWDGMEAAEAQAQMLTYKKGEPASPFGLLPMAASPQDLFECNSLWATAMSEGVTAPLAPYTPGTAERRGERIRVGYLSADFHAHATTALIAELFELHDRSRFELFGYSIGNQDESAMRQRVVAALDHFTDLNRLSHEEAAARIRADEIDILVDLKGYTSQARPQIVARRPAPIQVNYLGYPSTMGASFIDYIIADPVVAPLEHSRFYRESIVHLPNSYQPNDRKRAIGDYRPSRTQCGLPEEGFVFCCFNANYKLNTAMFDVWMRLLRAVPDAVMWLLQSNAHAPINLRREAAARGIDPARLVFAPKLPAEDHLARLPLGDLFLDTLPIGAHTTASEALWTGLPVLTCLGEAFPGRVGASLLYAMNMPEFVTTSLEGYEARAKELATDRRELSALRARLQANRDTAPLFDTDRYVRNFQGALLKMIELRDAGLPPRPFAVDNREF